MNVEVEQIFESRRIRHFTETPNSLTYYQGVGSNYPKDGTYLDPNSEYRNRFIDMASWISSTLGESGKVLDVGGATGNFGYWMQKMHKRIDVVHTDFSFDALTYSNENVYPHTPVQCEASKLPFVEKSFDGVLFADVLEHLDPSDAKMSLNEGIRILKPGGHIFINIPNRNTWTDNAFKEPSHIWLPSIEDMRLVLELLGLKDIISSTRGFPLISKARNYFKKDPRFPIGGTSIFISAKR